MIGAEADNLSRFVISATSYRAGELAKAKPIDVRRLSVTFADGREAHLVWTTGRIDDNGNPLPDDWTVTVD